MSAYRDARVAACLDAEYRRGADGIERLRSTVALGPYPDRLTDRLEHWARLAPDRTLVARRERGGHWRRIGYAQMLERARAIGQALVERGLGPERPVAILSGNDLEHLSLALGAMWAGVPYAPVSPAYSLLSQDHGKLRHVLNSITPGLLFASGPEYAKAIRAVADPDIELVMTDGRVEGRAVTPFDALLGTAPGAAVDAAHAQVGPDTIAKFLFTSGSTRVPKGVINTHRMLCSNQQMLCQAMAFLADEPPVLVDWLPWNHTFGGNHNTGITIYNGGTLYIDDGKPTAQGIGETLRNLREISPTVYFNVPKGFEEIVAAMRSDDVLRQSLFARVKAFMFAGAGLSQPVWDELDRIAEQTIGERVPMITGLGMTETAPSCTFALRAGDVRSGHIGLPCPGVEVKLVPAGGKTEIRFRGPNVMPGYWRLPEATAHAFDEEGFYRTGDAVKWIDPADPRKGLMFDGRIAEDFKLSTGTFVSVGPLRARIIAAGAPCVQDAVITGIDRDDVGMLVFPRLDECRKLAAIGDDVGADEVLRHPVVRAHFQSLVDRMWREGTGSASRVARAHVMSVPPSIDRDEVTDKGSINQQAVLRQRAALVEALYRDAGTDDGILLPRTG
ncbi:MAG: feruloyl-CoA synthase [Burkholderiaceae bacterium]|jgi:feruloyl-CoA synthase|nr:feruloyl-CoA synthase [Burkholderiaceae bacterium]